MRKATKILLIISEVVCFVGIAVLAALGILYICVSRDPQVMLDYLLKTGMTGVTIDTAKAECVIFTTIGIIMIIAAVFCIPAGIFTVHCRRKFFAGTTKQEMKSKAIWLIVLGALSCELPIVPAIFMLAMGENNFKD